MPGSVAGRAATALSMPARVSSGQLRQRPARAVGIHDLIGEVEPVHRVVGVCDQPFVLGRDLDARETRATAPRRRPGSGNRCLRVFKSCAVITIICADLTSSPDSPIASG